MRIDLEADGVRAHASSVESLRSRTSQASSAVSTTMSAEAFGLMNVALAGIAAVVATAGRMAIEGLASDLGETGTNLRQLATNAETTDGNVDARMRGYR
ncbi:MULTISPECIES: hypothetical protein [unclassified Phycicoccus]|uniref:hypothetical protein n=1 Tax=unclassified Phycicoccus TaxID=2637926 RepID=UPI00070311CB|nr:MULTISPECIES: hypothetical protein [unclassified Phycicoccus]KQU65232.1 hypothetical protein ASC58_17155 [Phycicoccus sp. Root101]KQZ89640.1 hypothetical protein ASD62_10315 [Phycicoccus sp. Root563]